VTTTVLEFQGCKDVHLDWFMEGRKGPIASYAEMIAGYDPSSEHACYPEGCVDGLFTADESDQLLRYLNEHHGGDAHLIKPAKLPISMNQIGFGAIPVGGAQDYYMLYKEDGYDLPFKIMGYYDLRHYDPVPGQEEARRRAFARSRLMIHEGRLV